MNNVREKLENVGNLSLPWVILNFIGSDGKTYRFFSVVHKLSGDRITGFEDSRPGINDSIEYVKSVLRDLIEYVEILSYEGTDDMLVKKN